MIDFKSGERKEAEKRRQGSGTPEERLLYYADFYDLKTIIKKNIDNVDIKEALGDWRTLDVFLSQLEKYRDPDAHRRELLPHQKYLIMGISGEIRGNIVRYRNKLDSINDYFPRLESVRDNLGNLWIPGKPTEIRTNTLLRVGDVLNFVVTATDPEDLELEYLTQPGENQWSVNNELTYEITERNIGTTSRVTIAMKSPREYHAHAGNAADEWVTFIYSVLPRK